jgi:hypothetical protein
VKKKETTGYKDKEKREGEDLKGHTRSMKERKRRVKNEGRKRYRKRVGE